jgi:hypothetical protein
VQQRLTEGPRFRWLSDLLLIDAGVASRIALGWTRKPVHPLAGVVATWLIAETGDPLWPSY